MRYLFGFLCVCALGLMPLVGCSETSGTGGSGGDGGGCGSGGNGGVGGDGGSGGMTGQEFPCTEQGIRDAIAEGGGPHTFSCNGPTTVVTEAEIVIDNNVILDGEGNLTVDGDNDHRVFSVDEGVTAELYGLTVTRGGWVEPGAFDEHGGGIFNKGTLTLANCSVTQCSVPATSNPMGEAEGGGIRNDGTLMLTNCTVSENSVDGLGGGISSGGSLTLTNSTVSGNSPVGVQSSGEATLTNTTVSGNAGGGILNGRHTGIMFLTNCTVSGNISSGITPENLLFVANSLIDGDCTGDVISYDFNIESPGDTCRFPREFDKINVSATDLNLGPLAANGGPTMTHKPGDGGFGDGSVAIDAVPNRFCDVNLTEDQRGQPRPETDGTMCDVGSVEVQPKP
jgi:hypothetical protein